MARRRVLPLPAAAACSPLPPAAYLPLLSCRALQAALHPLTSFALLRSLPAGQKRNSSTRTHTASGPWPRPRTTAAAAAPVEQQQQGKELLPELLDSEEHPEEEGGQQQGGEEGMGPAAKKQRVDGADGGGGGQPQPQQHQQKKKKKAPTPEQAVRSEIHQAAKANDLAAALAAFDRAKAGGIRLSPDLYVSLLYLCGGGDSWVQQLRQQEATDAAPAAGEAAAPDANGSGPAAAVEAAAAAAAPEGQQPDASPAAALLPQPCAEEVLRRAQGLFDEMQASQGRLHLNEMCYTAMARLAAGGGDADKAFQLAQASRAGWAAECGVVTCSGQV